MPTLKPRLKPAYRAKLTRKPVYVVVSKKRHGATHEFVADPEKIKAPPPLTRKTQEALQYKDKSGAYRVLRRFPELKKTFKTAKVAL